jgi:hypothetical protein
VQVHIKGIDFVSLFKGDTNALMFDRDPRWSTQDTVAILQVPLDKIESSGIECWSFNHGRGEGQAARRYRVPVWTYSVKPHEIASGSAQLGMAAVEAVKKSNSVSAFARSHNVLLLMGCDVPLCRIYLGVCLTPNK